MITLYIPTTTLNFNNILSSESISPKAFYERREYGYKRWTTIPENDDDNAIFLYDKLPSFDRPDNGLEDHPLVVQVSLDENQVKEIGNGIYYSDKTIYLDPWHTRFIFQSDKDRLIALSMSDSSSETKLLRLYRNLLEVRKGEERYDVPFNNNITLNETEISNDFRLNRIKGLLYGYYIGANMSLRKEDVKEIVAMRELQDILSSIQSSDDHAPSSSQRERLKQLLGLGLILYDMDIRNGQMLSRVESSISWLEQSTDSKKVLLLPDNHEIEVSNGHVLSLRTVNDDKEQELFKAWTDFLFSFGSSKYNGKISTINKELSDELTVIAKGVYGEEWEGSHTKSFLNNLRRHIRGEVFDEQWGNNLLSSVAAVLTHGDDWHKLLSFMQSKGMYDYRLAFAFYGVLNGFANLTRDFTDNIYNTSSEYIASVYKEVYRQLFGKSLVVKTMDIKNDYEQAVKKPQVVSEPAKSYSKLREKVKEFCSVNDLSKQQKEGLRRALVDNGNNENVNIFLKILKIQKGWSKGKKLNLISELLGKKQNTLPKQQRKALQPDLFGGSSIQSFAQKDNHSIINDPSAIEYIKECQYVLKDNTDKVVQMFNAFQRSYQNGYYSQHSEQYHRNNWDVIDHFCKWCFSKKNRSSLVWAQDTSKAIEELKEHLMKIYPDR